MKTLRMMTLFLLIMSIFTVGAFATTLNPSPEYTDDPEIVGGDEDIIITPVDDDDIDIDIEDLVDIWEEITDGAPIDNIEIVDIFDVRYDDEPTTGLDDGKPFTIEIVIPGIGPDDDFIILVKETEDGEWKLANYTIDENGVITIVGTSMSVFAVIKDNLSNPAVVPGPDSPQTGVSANHIPAVVGAVIFMGIAAVTASKIKRHTAA